MSEALTESPIIHHHTQNRDKWKHAFLHSGHCLQTSSMIIISDRLIEASVVMATLLFPPHTQILHLSLNFRREITEA